ncbi:MAG TPA: DUF302 domain-containing protein [Bacteroidales bacterium]|nr:DUF302 domain-containing protein [Bacteroidales bacterium]
MNASVIEVVCWVLVGMVLMGLIVWFTMPLLMLIKHRSKLRYDETVNALSETLTKKQDWQVLTVNDYQKRTEAFVALERVGSVTICNPRYVAKILTDDKNRHVTAFMPLELGVYEDKKGQVFVSQLNVGLLGKMFGGTISEVMGMAGKDLSEAVESVSAK